MNGVTVLVLTATAAASGAIPADNGFDPAGLFLMLCMGAVLLVLIGIGLAIGLAGATCAALFVALGIVSSSALAAILRRRFSTGFRALHYQLSAAIALPFGIVALWAGRALLEFHLRDRYLLLFGSAIGVAAGVCMAFILDRFLGFVRRRLDSSIRRPAARNSRL